MSRGKRSGARRYFSIGLAAVAVLGLAIASRYVCIGAWIFDGVLVGECPDGELRQTLFVEAYDLRRGAKGLVRVGATAHYTTEEADYRQEARVRRLDATLALVKPDASEVALEPLEDGWDQGDDFTQRCFVSLPEVPDGEYTLRARVKSSIGDGSIDVPLPVFAPARIHVVTDRPLYEPGNTVQFRAVALRAKDLTPLDGRPGRWIVQDPEGETVLEEKAPAKDFGVAAGSFPLDAGAPHGTWHVRWVSGTAEDAVSFQVEPFTLPRFRVDASAPKPFYRRGERPIIRGKVVYSSGAPVKNAALDVGWSFSGAWPPPTEWTASLLPKRAETDASGAFELTMPIVPGDLRGRTTISAAISAVDAAGDRVAGGASVLLSEDAIQVATVTELADGLVAGFNNRLYLRATTAAGGVLADTELVVKRAWEPNDKGVVARTDEDGVAALQIDPGPPVNVVIPPMPYRPPARRPAISRGETAELLAGEPALADQLAMDRWNADLAPCARFAENGSDSITAGFRVDPSGAISAVAAGTRPIDRCARSVLASKRLPAGRARLYRVSFHVNAELPQVTHELEGVPSVHPSVEYAFAEAALDARSCVPDALDATALPRVVLWSFDAKAWKLTTNFAGDPAIDDQATPAGVASCIEAKLARAQLPPRDRETDEGDEEGAGAPLFLGVGRFSTVPAPTAEGTRPVATTLLGYELRVIARAEKEEIGATKIFINPGAVPPIRLRAAPVLAEAGGTVELTVLRGPEWRGELPEKLYMSHEQGTLEAKLDPKTRVARFQLPAEARGWFETSWGGGRALVYVRPKAELSVAIKPGADTYAPGQTAELAITTQAGGKPARAAVGLIGVDSSLAQLASLPGPDDMARLRPKAGMSAPAFDVLDAGALALGRIRGANAAVATILRVTSVPAHVDLDASINASAYPTFEPLEALTDNFYTVLTELHARVREWEEKAPSEEEMHPQTMAKLWDAALRACEARKQAVTDAYGRRLRLHRLPEDLLALTDPRAIVVDGARLPEDIENWSEWVAKERP